MRCLRQALTRSLTQAWYGHGVCAKALSWALWPLSLVLRGLLALRRQLYGLGLRTSQSLAVPVIVVGNVLVGGVGKTPVVMALVSHLVAQGWRVGVLSRGYGRRTQGVLAVHPHSNASDVGDEPLLIARRCQVPVYVGAKRVAAGQALLAAHPEVQVLVCDDGLQHWALARDIELCVFDERGTGNGRVLPAGPLREPWPRRADANRPGPSVSALPMQQAPAQTVPCWVIKTAGTPAANEWPAQRRLADWAEQADGTRRALSHWGHTPVQALAGIAKPEAFFDMLRAQGLNLSHTHTLPDHADLSTWACQPEDGDVLCTEKDAVKLWAHAPQAWAVPLQTTLPSALLKQIEEHLNQLQTATKAPK